MSLDITPTVPQGRQVIQKYGGGGFKIAGVAHQGSVLVHTDGTEAWGVTSVDGISTDSLSPILSRAGHEDAAPGILIIGCGERFTTPPPGLRQALKEQGVVLEWMDTGAACRTFNVLLIEERNAVAALIAID